MHKILIEQGIDENVNSPRSLFRHAHYSGLIDNVQAWNDFIEKRNLLGADFIDLSHDRTL